MNRLHGEIDITFAENPDITPGEMLAKLNKYVHLTLAKHSIYATAVCLRVDHKRGIVEYASGGHPPAFIRGVDGTLRDLDPTTFVLGACSEEDFDSAQVEADLMPGDSLIVYTDGAIEARATDGKMMLIGGASQDPRWRRCEFQRARGMGPADSRRSDRVSRRAAAGRRHACY